MKKDVKPLDYRQTRPTEGGASFSRSNRFERTMWMIVWKLLAAWTPTPMHSWRVAILRLFGADIDSTAHVYASARVWLPRNLIMRHHACLGPDVNCYNMALIRLDEYVIISQGAHLCSSSHNIDDSFFQLTANPITIEKQAWVAAEAFVGPGVTIHQGAVLGARGVLFKDAEAWGVYVGNPAALVRYRRHPTEIAKTTST